MLSIKKENLKSKFKKLGLNFFPAYWLTGAKITFLSDDWQEAHIKLSLSWKTRNYVGTVFGGSIYSALDPIYMVQLINILGNEYVVWDKSANIKFIRPIKKTVFAKFIITDQLISEIKDKIRLDNEMTINLPIQFKDNNNILYSEVIKDIYIADKEYYSLKRSKK